MVSAENPNVTSFCESNHVFSSGSGTVKDPPRLRKTVSRQSFILDGKQPPPGCFLFAENPIEYF